MKRMLLRITIFSVAVIVLYRIFTMDERRLAEYSAEWFTAQHLTSVSFSCSMMGNSGSRLRAGRCYFTWQPSQVDDLKQKLNLVPATADPSGACGSFASTPGAIAFSSSTPPGPIFPGNTQSSFKALYLNESTGQGCLELFYPYG